MYYKSGYFKLQITLLLSISLLLEVVYSSSHNVSPKAYAFKRTIHAQMTSYRPIMSHMTSTARYVHARSAYFQSLKPGVQYYNPQLEFVDDYFNPYWDGVDRLV